MQASTPVRRMLVDDVRRVVYVHRRAFEGFFLTSLGPSFLEELYTAVCLDPTGIALVCEADDEIVGFVAGSADPREFYGRLLRSRWWRFALASIQPALKRPAIIPRLLRAFNKVEEGASAGRDGGELMSISVLPDCRGRGTGRKLVGAFLQEARERELRIVRLTTDGHGNEAANRFYRRLGFTCLRSFTTSEGREMNEYEIVL